MASIDLNSDVEEVDRRGGDTRSENDEKGRTSECSIALVALLSFYWINVSHLRFMYTYVWLHVTLIKCIVAVN